MTHPHSLTPDARRIASDTLEMLATGRLSHPIYIPLYPRPTSIEKENGREGTLSISMGVCPSSWEEEMNVISRGCLHSAPSRDLRDLDPAFLSSCKVVPSSLFYKMRREEPKVSSPFSIIGVVFVRIWCPLLKNTPGHCVRAPR